MKIQSLILTILLSILPFFLSAQENYLAVKAGYNHSTLQSDGDAPQFDLSARRALNIALVYCSKMRDLPIGFSIEPGYTLKGTRVDHDTLDYKFHYFSLPVLFDFYPTEYVKISAGPELSYLMSARSLNDTITTNMNGIYDKRWELSGTVGISVSPTFFMDVGMRYNMAFTYAAREDELLGTSDLYNKYFQVYLVFKIAN